MTEAVCVHCGQPTRYSVGDVFQCKGGCVLPVPEIKAKRAAKKKPMTVTAPAPPPDPEPHAFVPQPRDSRYCNVCDKTPLSHPEPEPEPKPSRYPWRRKQ